MRADSAPGGLVLFLEIVVCLSKSTQHFCRRFEKRLGSRIIDFRNVLAGVLCGILQHALDIGGVMSGDALRQVWVWHRRLLALLKGGKNTILVAGHDYFGRAISSMG